jgi:hypothetical protein
LDIALDKRVVNKWVLTLRNSCEFKNIHQHRRRNNHHKFTFLPVYVKRIKNIPSFSSMFFA